MAHLYVDTLEEYRTNMAALLTSPTDGTKTASKFARVEQYYGTSPDQLMAELPGLPPATPVIVYAGGIWGNQPVRTATFRVFVYVERGSGSKAIYMALYALAARIILLLDREIPDAQQVVYVVSDSPTDLGGDQNAAYEVRAELRDH